MMASSDPSFDFGSSEYMRISFGTQIFAAEERLDATPAVISFDSNLVEILRHFVDTMV